MNLQDLQTLLDYNYWARDRMFDACEALTPEQTTRDLGGSFGSIHDTLTHLYSAELVWYDEPTPQGAQQNMKKLVQEEINIARALS